MLIMIHPANGFRTGSIGTSPADWTKGPRSEENSTIGMALMLETGRGGVEGRGGGAEGQDGNQINYPMGKCG